MRVVQRQQGESGPGRGRERLDPRREGGLKTFGQRQPPGAAASSPGQADRLRQLEQGERIPLGQPEHPGLGRRTEVGRHRGKQPGRVLGGERRQVEHAAGHAAERVGFVVPGRGQQHDRVVLESTGDEAEHVQRPRIEPLQVLGHHQQGLLGGRVGQQVEGRHGQREGLRRGADGDPEGSPQGRLPGLWDQLGQRKQRLQQLVQPGHGQARLRRVAEGPQDPPGRPGPPHGVLDQRGLADAGRSPDQDRGAGLPVGQAVGDQALLGIPADEKAAVNNAAHSRHNYRVSHPAPAAVPLRSRAPRWRPAGRGRRRRPGRPRPLAGRRWPPAPSRSG